MQIKQKYPIDFAKSITWLVVVGLIYYFNQFPVLFLGTAPAKTPALYSLMTYSGIKQGTFYPMGGFGKVIDGMAQICKDLGVTFHLNAEIKDIEVVNKNLAS